jgi:hypothetical protein
MKIAVSVIRKLKPDSVNSTKVLFEQTTSHFCPKIVLDKKNNHAKFAISIDFYDAQSRISFEAFENGNRCVSPDQLTLASSWTIVPTTNRTEYTILFRVLPPNVDDTDFEIELYVLPNK